MKKFAVVLFVILTTTILLSGCSSTPNQVTLQKYSQISSGDSYARVCGIIGKNGEEMSSSEMPGVPGVMPSIRTVMYVWKNPDGSNMNAMFQNDKLVAKAQFGLK